MKTISHRRSSSNKKIIVIMMTGFLLVVMLLTSARHVGGVLSFVSIPLRSITSFAPHPFDSFISFWKGRVALEYERDTLRASRDATQQDLTTLKASITDYEMLNTMRVSSHERILAGVLMAPNNSPYDSLVIDKGSNDGVINGALVYGATSRPLGVVVRSEANTAIIALLTSPGIESNVYVFGANVHAKAVGMGGGVMGVTIPHGVKVGVGDTVILPTLSENVIGTISTIADDPDAPGIVAFVPQKDTLASLRYVTVARTAFTLPSRAHIQETITAASTTFRALFVPLHELSSTTASTTH